MRWAILLLFFILAALCGWYFFSTKLNSPTLVNYSGMQRIDFQERNNSAASAKKPSESAASFSTATDAFSSLKPAAERGSGAAACELVAVQLYCRDVISQGLRLEAALGKEGDEGGMQMREQEWKAKARYCEGFVQLPEKEYLAYLRKAAKSGYSKVQSIYSLGGFFSSRNAIKNIDEMQAYKLEAPRIAESAASHGDVRVAYELANSYAGLSTSGNGMLAQTVDQNYDRAGQILMALREIYARDAESNPLSKPMLDVIERKIEKVRDMQLQSRGLAKQTPSDMPFVMTAPDKKSSRSLALPEPSPGLEMCR